MINMKMSKEEAKEYTAPSPSDAPEYPYGLTIDVDDDGLAKLGITDMPAVGTEMLLTARVVVNSTRAYDKQNGEAERGMCLQITDMQLEAGAPRAATEQVLYRS